MRPRRVAAAVAAALGCYVAGFMYRKAIRAERGELAEPSIVEKPAARMFFGIPNAAIGLAYYGGVLAALPFADRPIVRSGLRAAAGLAALQSAYLAYSLLFVTRMPCPYCWSGHAINALLLGLFLTDGDVAR